jgi:hypothetical protein
MAKRRTKSKAKIALPVLERRRVRYIMFRIREGVENEMDRDLRVHAAAIRQHFDQELEEAGFVWRNFTFEWDVSATNPYKVIKRDLRVWVEEGGSFIGRPPGMTREDWARHVVSSLLENAETPPLPLDPPAFTKQG